MALHMSMDESQRRITDYLNRFSDVVSYHDSSSLKNLLSLSSESPNFLALADALNIYQFIHECLLGFDIQGCLGNSLSHTIYAGASISVIQTTHQIVEATAYTNLLSLISVVAFIFNIAAALWAFSFTGDIEHESWKILVFKTVFYFTAIISPYSAVATLFPKTLEWYFCAIISFTLLCLTITIFKNKIKGTLALAYGKVVDAIL